MGLPGAIFVLPALLSYVMRGRAQCIKGEQWLPYTGDCINTFSTISYNILTAKLVRGKECLHSGLPDLRFIISSTNHAGY